MSGLPHGAEAPSSWITRWAHLLTPGARVLDVACGAGRHTRWLAAQGHLLTAVDRNADALADLDAVARVLCADIENCPWPLAGERFDAVVVTNYLWRPLWPTLLDSLAPGGVLLYETFAHGNASVGKPSRPDFLLQPGELLLRCQGLRVVGYEDGFCAAPERFVQRICAVREVAAAGDTPPRYPLPEPAR
jgi:SAM-dependent methyltransferase